MVEKLEFKQYNFKILNFCFIFKNIEKDLINDLHNFNLLNGKINSSVKKLFFHHTILGLCEYLLNDKSREKNVVYFNSDQTGNWQILKYYEEEKFIELLSNIISKIKKLLPIKIFTSNISFEFLTYLLQKNDGRSEELIVKIRSFINSVNLERYTFSKILTFTKENDLVFLNKQYFNRLKAKQLIIV